MRLMARKVRSRKSFALAVVVLLASSALLGASRQLVHDQGSPRFVSLSIILEGEGTAYYETLVAFLRAVGYHNWTFVVTWSSGIPDFWLNNSTRRDKLLAYGDVILRLPYPQAYTVADRLSNISQMAGWYHQRFGYYPRGWFNFCPDTNVALTIYRNYSAHYYQGGCFDQYRIDFMSMRGGFQLPYYASLDNALVPSLNRSLVMLPHASWDWIDSLQVTHNLQLHPQNLISFFGNGLSAKRYLFQVLDRNARGCNPFSFSCIQFEWKWLCDSRQETVVANWFTELLTRPYSFASFAYVADWFSDRFGNQPEYSVKFVSPRSGKGVEWYFSRDKRISRVDGRVNSLVEYDRQFSDPYLATNQIIDWSRPACPNEAGNEINISLNFTIDSFGGGLYRAPISDGGVPYDGALCDFS